MTAISSPSTYIPSRSSGYIAAPTPITTATAAYFTSGSNSNTYHYYVNGAWITVDAGTTSDLSYSRRNNLNDYLLQVLDVVGESKKLKIPNGWEARLPDDSVIRVDNNGNFVIIDEHTKVVYKANRLREFNKYINASDLVEMFIKYVGTLGVKQSEVMSLPIELFINWLIIEACKFDEEAPPELPVLPNKKREYFRCMHCGKFISKAKHNLAKFCNPEHYMLYTEKALKV